MTSWPDVIFSPAGFKDGATVRDPPDIHRFTNYRWLIMNEITKVIVQYSNRNKMKPSNDLHLFKKSLSDEKHLKYSKVLLWQ